MKEDQLGKIWNLSKLRFLCDELSWGEPKHPGLASLCAGFLIFVFFEFFSPILYEGVKYIGISLFCIGIANSSHRTGLRVGYWSGYERGFTDAALKNLKYQSLDEIQDVEYSAIETVLDDISKNISELSHSDKKTYLCEGHEKYFLDLFEYVETWRKQPKERG